MKGAPKPINEKPRKAQSDDDEGPSDNQSKAKAEESADGVRKKTIKLNPVIPALETAESSSDTNSTGNGTMNATSETSGMDAKDKQNENQAELIKQLVKNETEKMAKQQHSKEDFLKNQAKPTTSDAVDSKTYSTEKDKVAHRILKIKDYDLEKDMSKKPKVNKTKEMEESGEQKQLEKQTNLKKKE